jgi:hypothetical protein
LAHTERKQNGTLSNFQTILFLDKTNSHLT